MANNYRASPRMVIEITPEQKNKLNQYIAHGEQRRVFSAILTDVISMLDEFGHDFILFILEREFTYRSHMMEYYANKRSTHTAVITADTTGTDRVNTEHPC